MKTKLIIIFALIILIPTAAIVYLGINLTKSEEVSVKEKFRNILIEHLVDIEKDIAAVIEAREQTLIALSDFEVINSTKLTKLIGASPLINQIFVLDKQRKVIYPNLGKKRLTENERKFFERTQEVWKSGETFYHPNEDVQAVEIKISPKEKKRKADLYSQYNIPKQEVFEGYASRSKLSKLNILTDTVELDSGWYTWFYGRGVNLILWKRTGNDLIIGMELNRSRLLADIISILPDKSKRPDALISLESPSGRIYSWGKYEASVDARPQAEFSLRAPLDSWKLQYFQNEKKFSSSFSRSLRLNLIVGALILGLTVFGLCIYFYRENNRQLRESSQKVNFVNQVSHELKTPLTNIRMYAELLERQLDSTEVKAEKHLKVIVSESQRLSRLINNVLSFARKDKDKLTLNIRDVSVDVVIDDVIDHFSPLLHRKNISIALHKCAPAQLKADPDALAQIIGNLLSNVEKYVPTEGSVKIISEQDERETKITVVDDGPGIPEKQQAKIFDAFHRVSNKLSDGVSGTGIGLSIARELALMHGGELILLTSDKGASFQLVLPVKN
ncbi:MAG: HAMP domain-containing histidine kinase [Lentisphaeraceae bacterium]|nr:HAMP domain-containing histidine kinase [Lentisphaeraceae bacterium]